MKRWFAIVANALGLAVAPASGGGSEPPANVYTDLRTQALSQTPATLGSSDSTVGVLMETGYPGAVVTLVAFVDGSASLYFSNGGGIIGAGQHERVAAAAQALVTIAARYLSSLTATAKYPLPGLGRTRFHVLTASGVLTAEAAQDDLGNNRLPLSPLFHAGHALIAEIRAIEERR